MAIFLVYYHINADIECTKLYDTTMISTHQVRALTSRRFDSIITWFAFITSKKSPVYHHRSGNNRGFITNYLLSQKANITKGLHSHIKVQTFYKI